MFMTIRDYAWLPAVFGGIYAVLPDLFVGPADDLGALALGALISGIWSWRRSKKEQSKTISQDHSTIRKRAKRPVFVYKYSFNCLARIGCRNLRRALPSICRMRSRVRPNFSPTSSSVYIRPFSKPNRKRRMRASLALRVPQNFVYLFHHHIAICGLAGAGAFHIFYKHSEFRIFFITNRTFKR